MPQMAPMNWMFLYMLFILIFMMMNFLNYYIFLIKSPSSFKKLHFFKTLNWKW
uniref:ATP synthase complex subunit 8 n=1 Tax=Platychile pallida TaxID=175620 RepID=A0A343EYS5_9CARA|nr:ATP synthase F0 subunit 8 [Platychile pallida]